MKDNYDFITMAREPKNLKEMVDSLFRNAQRIADSRISSKSGEIKGLYSAYELSNSQEILEAICKKMGEIIQDLIIIDGRRTCVVAGPTRRRVIARIIDEDWYDEFADYLRTFVGKDGEKDLSQGTIGLYLRAFRRILNDEKHPYRDFDSLYADIDVLIVQYEEKIPKNFIVIAVLKYFRDFARMYVVGKRENYRIVISEESGDRVLWKGYCSEIYSIEKFKRILRQIVEERHLNNDKSRWKPIRLYDSQDNIIKQES